MGIVSWIILGLLAGGIAKILLPGRDPGGLLGTLFFGVAGAFVGGWLSAKFLDRPVRHDFFDGANWLAAIGGALVLLIAYRLVFGNSRNSRR
ncbi:GlsB/YeaQ/YmgE family stress response membrane protein [Streptomyces sp. NBC_01476]|uniref:GlsB/YeaQ/YmgE family stress response membrane protein n=1 Tax=Streptomyces sp. NBC_01476 TaxID=2903881 RepID=UPI002E3196ED|nr:GlsB/YeaQ/YmgE family stress response membrane protein [Streptomyces sp. NBC_01476]